MGTEAGPEAADLAVDGGPMPTAGLETPEPAGFVPGHPEADELGVLDRFAYISYFAVCLPGQEDAAFERLKQLMVESVPLFQLVPRTPSALAAGAR